MWVVYMIVEVTNRPIKPLITLLISRLNSFDSGVKKKKSKDKTTQY